MEGPFIDSPFCFGAALLGFTSGTGCSITRVLKDSCVFLASEMASYEGNAMSMVLISAASKVEDENGAKVDIGETRISCLQSVVLPSNATYTGRHLRLQK